MEGLCVITFTFCYYYYYYYYYLAKFKIKRNLYTKARVEDNRT
jgi:hypothetical protein